MVDATLQQLNIPVYDYSQYIFHCFTSTVLFSASETTSNKVCVSFFTSDTIALLFIFPQFILWVFKNLVGLITIHMKLRALQPDYVTTFSQANMRMLSEKHMPKLEPDSKPDRQEKNGKRSSKAKGKKKDASSSTADSSSRRKSRRLPSRAQEDDGDDSKMSYEMRIYNVFDIYPCPKTKEERQKRRW